MIKLPIILLVATLIVSCSRDPNSANNTPTVADGTVQYKVNGHLVTISRPIIEIAIFSKITDRVTGIDRTNYIFDAEKETNKNELVFAILSDSLSLGNYTYDSTHFKKSGVSSFVNYNGQNSVLYYWGDYLNINITSYSKGLISGNFTARFSPGSPYPLDYSARGTTLITEGQFKNIQCFY